MGNWIVLILVVIGVIVYYANRKGWLDGIKGIIKPSESDLSKIEEAIEKEREKTEGLKKMLEAKTALAEARAANAKLKREIETVGEAKSGKDKPNNRIF